MTVYTIRRVDGDEYADDLERLQLATELPKCPYDDADWFCTFFEGHPVGYLAIMQSRIYPARCAYLVRVGVLPQHRGNRLQLRMMRAAERFVRREAYVEIVSDTTQNPHSANNFIRAGYETFIPITRWSFDDAIYWRKRL